MAVSRSAFLCSAVLAGCGSVAALPSEDHPLSASAVIREAAFHAMSARFEDAGQSQVLPAGAAEYSGYLVGTALIHATGDSLRLVMDAQLTADFDAATVSGAFGRPGSVSGEPISGSILLTHGRIEPDGFTADLSGQLGFGGAEYSLSGSLDGAFLGASADGLSAQAEGVLGKDKGEFSASIVAERR